MHPSYYHGAHACILAFDVTRKVTYKNLAMWYKELREYRPHIPCIVVANKIDVDYKVTQKAFAFASKHDLPFYFVSAADGTNVVKFFEEAIEKGHRYKENPPDFVDHVLQLLEEVSNVACKEKATKDRRRKQKHDYRGETDRPGGKIESD